MNDYNRQDAFIMALEAKGNLSLQTWKYIAADHYEHLIDVEAENTELRRTLVSESAAFAATCYGSRPWDTFGVAELDRMLAALKAVVTLINQARAAIQKEGQP